MREFLTYYRAARLGTARDGRKDFGAAEIILMVISALIYMLAIGIFNGDASDSPSSPLSMLFLYALLFLYASALGFGVTRRTKPSALNLVPVSYKKRTVFAYFAVLISVLIFMSFWIIGFSAIFVIISGIAFLVTGEWFGGEIFSELTFVSACPQGIVFEIFLVFFTLGLGMAISVIKNKKIRYAAALAAPAAVCVFAFIMQSSVAGFSGTLFKESLFSSFNRLPLSWLWLTAFGLITVAVFALSVILGLKQEKPKNF